MIINGILQSSIFISIKQNEIFFEYINSNKEDKK